MSQDLLKAAEYVLATAKAEGKEGLDFGKALWELKKAINNEHNERRMEEPRIQD